MNWLLEHCDGKEKYKGGVGALAASGCPGINSETYKLSTSYAQMRGPKGFITVLKSYLVL